MSPRTGRPLKGETKRNNRVAIKLDDSEFECLKDASRKLRRREQKSLRSELSLSEKSWTQKKSRTLILGGIVLLKYTTKPRFMINLLYHKTRLLSTTKGAKPGKSTFIKHLDDIAWREQTIEHNIR